MINLQIYIYSKNTYLCTLSHQIWKVAVERINSELWIMSWRFSSFTGQGILAGHQAHTGRVVVSEMALGPVKTSAYSVLKRIHITFLEEKRHRLQNLGCIKKNQRERSTSLTLKL